MTMCFSPAAVLMAKKFCARLPRVTYRHALHAGTRQASDLLERSLRCDTHHGDARCSSFSVSARPCSNEGAPDSRPAAASEVYYFCFVCEDAVDVSAEFLQIHLGTLIHGWLFEAALAAAFLQAKSKSARMAVLVCTLCRVHEQICVTRWCSHCK